MDKARQPPWRKSGGVALTSRRVSRRLRGSDSADSPENLADPWNVVARDESDGPYEAF